MAAPITKAAWRVYTPEEVPERLARGLRARGLGAARARSLLDIPMDVQRLAHRRRARPHAHAPRRTPADDAAVDELLDGARARRAPADPRRRRRPLERRRARAARRCSSTLAVPVVSSLHGVDVAALRPSAARRDDRQLRQPLGEPGDRPRRPPARARQPARHPPDRRRHRRSSRATATIFHVDCEPGEINNRVDRLPRRRRRPARVPRGASPRAARAARRGRHWQDELDERARALAGHRPSSRDDRGHQPERAHARALRGLGRGRRVRRGRRPAPDVGGAVARARRRPALPDLGRHGRDGLRPPARDRHRHRRSAARSS